MTLAITSQNYEALVSIGAIREAVLWEPSADGAARCGICQWRCQIREGRVGHCGTIINHNSVLYSTIYGVISSAAADPIEKKPVFHYKPGSKCYSVGTLGCNFKCVFCQNWRIAYDSSVTGGVAGCKTGFTAIDLVQAAKKAGCQGVAWTYNEPSIWLNYTLDCAKLCKNEGLYTVYVTNGYATPEGLDLIGPYLDVYRVDIKSMEDRFYRELIKAPSPKGVLEVAVRARHKWGMHVECVTNIIPGWNDGEENLTQTARWIADNLGESTPWHVTRFFPYGELSHIPPTPPETLLGAVTIGKQQGLQFVYIGNMQTETGDNTYCPQCGQLAVKRTGYATQITGLDEEGRCSIDHTDINIHR